MEMKFVSVFVLLGLLSASAVNAGERFVSKNEAGGDITLLSTPCVFKGQKVDVLKMVISTDSKGAVDKGCWMFDPDTQKPHVIYEDGTERYYEVSAFKYYKK